jgi:hypothetical protein
MMTEKSCLNARQQQTNNVSTAMNTQCNKRRLVEHQHMITEEMLKTVPAQLFKKDNLKTVQRSSEDGGLLSAIQFGFCVSHSMILQCMRLLDHISLNFNNNMSMVVVK